MRVIGVGLPEQTLMAPWTLPDITWLLSRASSLSLSTDARNRYTARSTMIAMIMTDVKRMGHMPHPPLWNAVEIAVSIYRSSNAWSGKLVPGLGATSDPRK